MEAASPCCAGVIELPEYTTMPNSSSFRSARGWLASAHHGDPRATDVPWAGAYPCVHRVRHGLALRVATAATTPLNVGIPLRIAGHRGGRRGRGVPQHVEKAVFPVQFRRPMSA